MLLQAAGAGRSVVETALWVGGLMVAAVVFGYAIVGLKRRVFTDPESVGPGWTLEDLRRLRDSGEVTIQQYEQLKTGVIGQLKSSAAAADNSETDGPRDADGSIPRPHNAPCEPDRPGETDAH